uniref:Uncharacterized protein n=1 Tax=Bacillus cereus HuA4-10 TaxID=1053206 RepID=J8DCT8_BACCE|nr:hypothetical protein IGC_03546 [Bacillus cereus HuA4-10]
MRLREDFFMLKGEGFIIILLFFMKRRLVIDLLL